MQAYMSRSVFVGMWIVLLRLNPRYAQKQDIIMLNKPLIFSILSLIFPFQTVKID